MKKRLIGLILAISMLFGIAPSALAASTATTAANTLYTLGLFSGSSTASSGTPDFQLTRSMTRAEAITLLVRMLGKDAAAKAETTTSLPFSDVADWAKPYVSYAYDEGLAKGVSKTAFGSENTVTATQFMTFLLRALGYSDAAGGDFTAATALQKADTISLSNGQYASLTDFTRGSAAQACLQALYCTVKDTDKTLLETLLEAKVVTLEQVTDAKLTDALTIGNAQAQLPTSLTALPTTTKGTTTGTVLNAEQISAKCSSAVFYIELYDAEKQAIASGSGFFLNSSGLAVTNYHVIDGASYAKVQLTSGKVYDIKGVYAYDKAKDLALIQVDCTGVPYLSAGDTSTIVGGAAVYAIGSPLGLSNTITEGIISNVSRTIETTDYIQTSAAISSGSSGGPLINKYGQVIGLMTATLTDGQNLNLAIPFSQVSTLNVTGGMQSLTAVAAKAANALISESTVTGYRSVPSVPDFGIFAGMEPTETDDTDDGSFLVAYYYDATDLSNTTITAYQYLLLSKGFVFAGVDSDNLTDYYIFDNGKYAVATTYISGTNGEYYVVEIYKD